MAIRQRAIHSEDKHERHNAILDATERLLTRAPVRVANMAEVTTLVLSHGPGEAIRLGVERRPEGTIEVMATRPT